MSKINDLLDELELKIPFQQTFNSTVSASNAGWHIDHSILVINQIITAVQQSDHREYEWKLNVKRLIVFTLGRIPRGKAKAPKSVIPENSFSEENIRGNLETARKKIRQLNELHPDQFFLHPYFGKLNIRSTRRMLDLHTEHHLQIINDIINK